LQMTEIRYRMVKNLKGGPKNETEVYVRNSYSAGSRAWRQCLCIQLSI